MQLLIVTTNDLGNESCGIHTFDRGSGSHHSLASHLFPLMLRELKLQNLRWESASPKNFENERQFQ